MSESRSRSYRNYRGNSIPPQRDSNVVTQGIVLPPSLEDAHQVRNLLQEQNITSKFYDRKIVVDCHPLQSFSFIGVSSLHQELIVERKVREIVLCEPSDALYAQFLKVQAINTPFDNKIRKSFKKNANINTSKNYGEITNGN